MPPPTHRFAASRVGLRRALQRHRPLPVDEECGGQPKAQVASVALEASEGWNGNVVDRYQVTAELYGTGGTPGALERSLGGCSDAVVAVQHVLAVERCVAEQGRSSTTQGDVKRLER